MINERDADGVLLPDDQCLTPFGRWLRSSALDELPEMWNVLLGVILLSLSIVGVRVEIGAMLAALGLIGLGIAFAVHNILESLLPEVLADPHPDRR